MSIELTYPVQNLSLLTWDQGCRSLELALRKLQSAISFVVACIN